MRNRYSHQLAQRVRNVVVVCLTMISTPFAAAQGGDLMYQQGHQCFMSGDYLCAVEQLYTYRVLAGMGGQLSPDLLASLNQAIAWSEEQIRIAVATKQELDRYGHVTEVTVVSEGKADERSSRRPARTVPFSMPHARAGTRPWLPQDVPAVRAMQPPQDSVPRAAYEDLSRRFSDLSVRFNDLQNRHNLLEQEYQRCQERLSELTGRRR